MSTLLDMLTQQLGSGQRLGKLSGQLGADQAATKNAVGAALPMLLGALAKNSAQSNGADALDRALAKHDGSVLDNLDGFLDRPDVNDGNGILGHLLGAKRNAVEAGVSKASGLDASMVTKLMPMLAPVVMGALGRQKRQQGLNAGSLASLLGAEQQTIERSNPAMGMLGKLLDQDGDGNVADDLANMGKGLLGGLFRRR
jgi:hypothetical protein